MGGARLNRDLPRPARAPPGVPALQPTAERRMTTGAGKPGPPNRLSLRFRRPNTSSDCSSALVIARPYEASAAAPQCTLRERRLRARMTTVPSPFGEPLPDAPEPSASPNARFLAGTVPHGTDERVRFGNSIIGSACTHIGACLLALFIVGKMPVTPPSTHPVDDKASDMVWLSVPGPGRRGADAGDGKPEPLRKAERARPDTLPVATPPVRAHEPAEDLPKPDPVINIPPVNISACVVDLPGALTGLA